MDKIKRIINVIVPITACNFKCNYCYLAQTNSFSNDIPKLEYSIDHILKALTTKRLGGVCMMNLCAVGETLMAPYLYDLVEGLLKNGHYVTIVTNGSLKNKIHEYKKLDKELRKHLFFKFSYQYLELKRLNLLSVFFENIQYIEKLGISYSVEITANDATIPFINELDDICKRYIGASPHVIESRDNNNGLKKLTKLDNKEHMEKWNQIETPLINFQDSIWGEERKEFCYAGSWISTLYLQNGNLAPCFGGGKIFGNIFEDIESPIHFCPLGNNCQWEHCYAAYVLLTLGAIPELDTISYANIRDRVTSNKKHWVKKEMFDFMNGKFKNSNKELNNDEKNIVNWFQQLFINGKVTITDELIESLKKIFKENNIENVAIVGKEKNVNSLIELLEKSKINIKFILDIDYLEDEQKTKQISQRFKHFLKYTYAKNIKKIKTPYLNLYDKLPKVDTIISIDIINFDKEKNFISKFKKCKINLISDLVNYDK